MLHISPDCEWLLKYDPIEVRTGEKKSNLPGLNYEAPIRVEGSLFQGDTTPNMQLGLKATL